MGFSHLLSSRASLANFRATYNVPEDVNIAYCHEGDIDIQRRQGENTVFFPLMAILEGGVRFPVDPFILGTFRFYGLCPDQLPPNFYRVVSYVSRLNRLFGLQLNSHDINFMYSLCGNLKSGYYLKTRDMRVRLISCLPDSNRNSAGEFVRVSGNWFAEELPCAFSPRDVGRYMHFVGQLLRFNLTVRLLTGLDVFFFAETKRFKPNLRVVNIRDLNFVLRSEIFVHWDGQLRASHLILGVEPVYSTWQTFSQALLVDSPLLSYIDVRHSNFLPSSLTVGEARELGPRYTCSDELPPLRDDSAEQTGLQVASSSRAAPAWCPSFILNGKPLPSTTSVRVWDKGEGGRVAQSLARDLLLPEDVHVFYDGTDKSLARRLQWHTIAAAQMTYILNGWLKELAEDAGREKALKDVAETTAKEKAKAAATAEKKAVVSEKARAAAERRSSELEAKLGDAELKLGEAESLNAAQTEELANLRAALEASESKWYNKGFADAENSVEPVIQEVRRLAFEEAWFAALKAAGVPEDSPLRDSSQIPFPEPSSSA
ncbi:hypothetical protein SO802_027942 [Lithocarpus litseifolius]|uniref:Transposase (Putative), gypsy type n=1 Tax=Lithocarpus litseifolius TaxID=425828 RepID=A0AAW2BQD4_9ROSI